MGNGLLRHGVLERRIAAIVLPSFVCELAREIGSASQAASAEESSSTPRPLAVLLDDEGESVEAARTDVIDAVDAAAYSAGARAGQRVTEAMAFSARLEIVHLRRARVFAALATVAEVLLSFGVVAHVEPLDAVWLDVSGIGHLFGGEDRLLVEIEERVRALGFRANAAIADGPRIAEALARHKGRPDAVFIAAPGQGASALAPLSIGALPLSEEARSLFVRLGVLTVRDFARLPRAQVVARLSSIKKKSSRSRAHPLAAEASAAEVMALAMGHDPLPLEPYRAPDVLVEEASFEDGIETAPQLLFVLRAMVSRLSQRLLGRAQATNRIEMTIGYDKSIYRLRTAGQPVPRGEAVESSPSVVTVVELPAPLSHEGDLLRAFKAKLEQIVLVAPAVALRLALSRVVSAPRVQLDLSRDVTVSPDALPALLSELSAEIGASRIGVLSLVSTFRPEARSALVAVSESAVTESTSRTVSEEPARLFVEPISIGSLGDVGHGAVSVAGSAGHGAKDDPGTFTTTIFIGNEPFEISRIVFDRRLDGIEWWAPESASRDYLRVSLTSAAKDVARAGNARFRGNLEPREGVPKSVAAEAWIYVDRRTGESFLQGWWE